MWLHIEIFKIIWLKIQINVHHIESNSYDQSPTTHFTFTNPLSPPNCVIVPLVHSVAFGFVFMWKQSILIPNEPRHEYATSGNTFKMKALKLILLELHRHTHVYLFWQYPPVKHQRLGCRFAYSGPYDLIWQKISMKLSQYYLW